MTWDEFKAYVDAKITEQGKDGSIELSYIECYDEIPEDVSVVIENNTFLVIV